MQIPVQKAFPYQQKEFWQYYRDIRAQEFLGFTTMAKRGKARDAYKTPEGKDKKLAEQEYQRMELERSIRYCRETLGLGLKV